jgi:pSer/pThr/pTyr-binding forkhead associated (FHA) protein
VENPISPNAPQSSDNMNDLIRSRTADLQDQIALAKQIMAEQQVQAQLSKKLATFGEDTILVLSLDGTQTFELKPQVKPIHIGRRDPTSQTPPDVDLTAQGAYQLGVSRHHATLLVNEGVLVVQDMNSRNGTFINGERMPSGQTRPLNPGDELKVGKIALHIAFKS